MIKLQVIGNLGRDCVQRDVNGKNVINFSVAHKEKFKNASGMMQEKTIWVECSYWTDRVGIVPYLLKGTQVFVEGTPEVDSYKKQDGEPGATLRLRVREVQLLGRKDSSDSSEEPRQSSSAMPSQPVDREDSADDLPF